MKEVSLSLIHVMITNISMIEIKKRKYLFHTRVRIPALLMWTKQK